MLLGISFKASISRVIDDKCVTNKIPKHLGLWERMARLQPKTWALESNVRIDTCDFQRPTYEDDLFKIRTVVSEIEPGKLN